MARLLAALEEEGAVAQIEVGGQYSIGDGLLELSGRLASGRNLVSLARPFLTALSLEIDETVGLSVHDGKNVHYLDHVGPDTEVQVRDWTGEYAPLHLVPSGLVVLAHLPVGELESYLQGELLAATSNSVTHPQDVRTRVKQMRSVGYAWGFEEFAEGINSVAAPVYLSLIHI